MTVDQAAVLILLATAATAEPTGPWTWSLYEHKTMISLAHEVPDSDKLGAVLECAPASGAVKLSIYTLAAGDQTRVSLSAGDQALSTEARDEPTVGASPHLTARVQTASPVFRNFVSGGRLNVRLGERSAEVEVEPANRPKLERFAKLCG